MSTPMIGSWSARIAIGGAAGANAAGQPRTVGTTGARAASRAHTGTVSSSTRIRPRWSVWANTVPSSAWRLSSG